MAKKEGIKGLTEDGEEGRVIALIIITFILFFLLLILVNLTAGYYIK